MRALVIGSRMYVGYSYDITKARKATVVSFDRSSSTTARAVNRPVIRIDGETSTITMPGDAFEITFGSLLFLGPVKDEG